MHTYKINGTVTFEEYLECHKVLAVKRRLWIRGLAIAYGVGLLIYGTLFASQNPSFAFAIFGVLLIAYGVVFSPIQFRYRVKRNWDRYPNIKKEFDMVVSPEGVETTDDRGSPALSAWDCFVRFGESESLFLLYLSPLLPMCLPKRLIPAAELSGLRDLFSSSIVNMKQTGDEQRAARPESE